MTPAEKVIEAFGGVNKTARALGVSKSAVSRWQKRKVAGEIGLIPVWYHTKILALAKKNNLKIKVNDLVGNN